MSPEPKCQSGTVCLVMRAPNVGSKAPSKALRYVLVVALFGCSNPDRDVDQPSPSILTSTTAGEEHSEAIREAPSTTTQTSMKTEGPTTTRQVGDSADDATDSTAQPTTATSIQSTTTVAAVTTTVAAVTTTTVQVISEEPSLQSGPLDSFAPSN